MEKKIKKSENVVVDNTLEEKMIEVKKSENEKIVKEFNKKPSEIFIFLNTFLGVTNKNGYYKIISLMKLLPLVLCNCYLMAYGDGGTGKSFVFEWLLKIFSESGIPTVAKLRGDRRYPEEKPIMSEDLVIFEEVADSSEQTKSGLGFIKRIMTEKIFKAFNKKKKDFKASLVFIFNTYITKGKIFSGMEWNTITKNFPYKDSAFFERIHIFLPHFEVFFNKKGFSNSTEIDGEEFKNFLFSLRDKYDSVSDIDFDTSNLPTKRLIENVKHVVKGLMLLFYPYSLDNIPEYSIKGFVQIAKHFAAPSAQIELPLLTIDTAPLFMQLEGIKLLGDEYYEIIDQHIFMVERENNVLLIAIDDIGKKRLDLTLKDIKVEGFKYLELVSQKPYVITYKKTNIDILNTKKEVTGAEYELEKIRINEIITKEKQKFKNKLIDAIIIHIERMNINFGTDKYFLEIIGNFRNFDDFFVPSPTNNSFIPAFVNFVDSLGRYRGISYNNYNQVLKNEFMKFLKYKLESEVKENSQFPSIALNCMQILSTYFQPYYLEKIEEEIKCFTGDYSNWIKPIIPKYFGKEIQEIIKNKIGKNQKIYYINERNFEPKLIIASEIKNK
ncbi:MAG: hypothetical protein KGV57_03345 [Fusobacterium sp.]|nr:hypothetical protein [Fusobacterium sp.]